MKLEMNRMIAVLTFVLFALVGCGDDAQKSSSNTTSNGSTNGSTGNGGTQTGGLETGEGPCEAPSECANDVCVAIIDGNNPPNYCTQQCTGGDCPSGFYCDSTTFQLAGLSFCRFGDTEPVEPEVAEEPPRLPCKSDADCDDHLVCAEFMGERECTLPCTVEDDCTVSFEGFTFDFHTCGQDAAADRLACLPDLACYSNPQSCYQLDVPGF